jgi:hypothetical protein
MNALLARIFHTGSSRGAANPDADKELGGPRSSTKSSLK